MIKKKETNHRCWKRSKRISRSHREIKIWWNLLLVFDRVGVQLNVSSPLVSDIRWIAEFRIQEERERIRNGVRRELCVSTLLQLGERCTKRGDGLWGKRQAHGAQKLTRECALCVVSEPEASPYCVSPRVAFVSALVAPIVFCPHTCHPSPPPTTPLLFRPPRLFRESRPACKREEVRRGEVGVAKFVGR